KITSGLSSVAALRRASVTLVSHGISRHGLSPFCGLIVASSGAKSSAESLETASSPFPRVEQMPRISRVGKRTFARISLLPLSSLLSISVYGGVGFKPSVHVIAWTVRLLFFFCPVSGYSAYSNSFWLAGPTSIGVRTRNFLQAGKALLMVRRGVTYSLGS